ITLSSIHVSKNEQRQSSSCPFLIFQIRRECLARSIECSAHRGQGFRIVDIFDVAEWGYFVLLYLRPCKRGRLCVLRSGRNRFSSIKKVCEDCKSNPRGKTNLEPQFPKWN